GTVESPQAQGYLQLVDAQLSLRNPSAGLDNLNARVNLAGQRLELSRLDGTLNGGTLSGRGSLEDARGRPQNTNIELKADGVYLDFPQGLKTVSNITLDARNSGERIVVGGSALILDGGFSDDLNIDTGILAAVAAPRGLDMTEERNPLLESI